MGKFDAGYQKMQWRLEPTADRVRLFNVGGGDLSDRGDECAAGAREGAITTVGKAKFAPDFHVLECDQSDGARQHLFPGKARADQRNPQTGGDDLRVAQSCTKPLHI